MENGTRGKFFYIFFFFFRRGGGGNGREGNLTRTLLEEKFSRYVPLRDVRGNNEYRPSRKFATRSRRPGENTTYYNKPFRWLQVVGSRLLSAPFSPFHSAAPFFRFLCACGARLHVYPIFVSLSTTRAHSQEFQTFRVPVFFFFFSAGY